MINIETNIPSAPPPPPSLSKQLVRYILGFGVSVGIGLAPYLGKVDIPLFDSLLKLIPTSLHNTILPLSAALMGLVAVVIQWYGGEHLTEKWLSKAFYKTLKLTIASFIILFIVHVFVVVKVPYDGGSETFLVGFVRPIKPPCGLEISDVECIGRITLEDAAVQSFWGSFQIRIATLSLLIPYLGFTGSFGLLVGLLMLRDRFLEINKSSERQRE
jgi:hypothetical protein